jgi:hypothetical protein
VTIRGRVLAAILIVAWRSMSQSVDQPFHRCCWETTSSPDQTFVSKDDKQRVLRLLAERFNLVTHIQKRDSPIYAMLEDYLTQEPGRPVQDQTGLKGRYDFKLDVIDHVERPSEN